MQNAMRWLAEILQFAWRVQPFSLHGAPTTSEDMICLDCPQIGHHDLTMQASNSMEIEDNGTVMDHFDQQRVVSKLDARAPLK